MEHGRSFIDDMQQKLSDVLQWKVRNAYGWAVCMFFVNQVGLLSLIVCAVIN